ncbi:MAG: hypothetical protein WD055_01910 [Candidatus Dependentiae bacterium]
MKPKCMILTSMLFASCLQAADTKTFSKPTSKQEKKEKGKGKQEQKEPSNATQTHGESASTSSDTNSTQPPSSYSIASHLTAEILIKLKEHERIITDLNVVMSLSQLSKELSESEIRDLITILVNQSKDDKRITVEMIERAIKWSSNNPKEDPSEFNPENLDGPQQELSIWHTDIKPGIGYATVGAIAFFILKRTVFNK